MTLNSAPDFKFALFIAYPSIADDGKGGLLRVDSNGLASTRPKHFFSSTVSTGVTFAIKNNFSKASVTETWIFDTS